MYTSFRRDLQSDRTLEKDEHMETGKKMPSRRQALGTGLAALGMAATPELFAAPKKPGETRVLFLMGDYFHNPVSQQKNWYTVLRPAGWTLMFAQGAQFITPEALAQADLFVFSRYHKTNSLGWSPEPIIEQWPDEETVMLPEREKAIIANVERGMGLLAVHCAIWNNEHPDIMKLLGVSKSYMHTPVQPSYLHKLNPAHPITQGIEPQNLRNDEIFYADLLPEKTEVLFNLKGEEKMETDRAGGWTHEYGNGRVVVLLPGHNQNPYHAKSYKEIMWRSAHWAMKKEIPAAAFENGRPPERL